MRMSPGGQRFVFCWRRCLGEANDVNKAFSKGSLASLAERIGRVDVFGAETDSDDAGGNAAERGQVLH